MEWVSAQYGEGESANLAPGLRLSVVRRIGTKNGPPPKWRVTVFDTNLKREFDTVEEAKATALRAAKQWLAQALEAVS